MNSVLTRYSDDEAYCSANTTPNDDRSPQNSPNESLRSSLTPKSKPSRHFQLFADAVPIPNYKNGLANNKTGFNNKSILFIKREENEESHCNENISNANSILDDTCLDNIQDYLFNNSPNSPTNSCSPLDCTMNSNNTIHSINTKSIIVKPGDYPTLNFDFIQTNSNYHNITNSNIDVRLDNSLLSINSIRCFNSFRKKENDNDNNNENYCCDDIVKDLRSLDYDSVVDCLRDTTSSRLQNALLKNNKLLASTNSNLNDDDDDDIDIDDLNDLNRIDERDQEMNLAGELDEEMRRRRTLEPEDDDLRSEIMERELIQPDSSTHHIHNSSNFYARNSNNNNKIVSANSGRSHTVANAYNVNGLIKTNHDNIENSVIRNNTADNIAVSTLNNRETSTNNNHNLCLVCGDVSSGFHYGVASCEACKAFFKRTIQGNIEYRCLLSESCEISKRRRKACQACRLQKCFNVGMLREGVRLDRVRGGRQKYARGFPNVYNSSFTYKKNFQEEQNLINYLKNIQPQNLYDSNEAQILTDREIKSHYNHLDVISALADIELVAMVTWAKQLPDFSKLSLNDQILLFHYSWNEMLLLSFIHRSLPYSGRLHFSPTYSISKSEWSQTPMQELMHAISEVVKIFEINLCKLSVEEFLLLKALLVCNTEGLSKIQGISNISKLRKNLLDCLNHVTLITKCSDPYRISKILLCLPYLRQLDIESRNFWNKIKKEGKVCLRKLFVEMLEAF